MDVGERSCLSASPPYSTLIYHRYNPIPETEFYQTIFSRVYEQPPSADVEIIDSHRLAVLFLVFALGTLLDLDLPSLNSEATTYYQLGRAALSLDSILESQSIPAIQALVRASSTDIHGGLANPLLSAADESLHVPFIHRRAALGSDGSCGQNSAKCE